MLSLDIDPADKIRLNHWLLQRRRGHFGLILTYLAMYLKLLHASHDGCSCNRESLVMCGGRRTSDYHRVMELTQAFEMQDCRG